VGAVLLAGCKVEGEVVIRVRDDGSGTVAATVRLDAAAVERIERIGGGPLAERFRIDDLVGAGWRTGGWRAEHGGGARLVLRHPFGSPVEAGALVAELVGGTGLYRDARVAVERSAFRDERDVALTVDLRALEVDVVEDAAVARRLEEVGVDPAAIDLLLTAEALDGLTLAATVEVAGRRDSARVHPGEVATVSLHAERVRAVHVAYAVAAAMLALAALGFATAAGISTVRAHRRGRARRLLDSHAERGGEVGEGPQVHDPGGR
jgi:hypothetical protein